MQRIDKMTTTRSPSNNTTITPSGVLVARAPATQASLPLCELIVITSNDSNSTTSVHKFYNQTVPCRIPGGLHASRAVRVKTYHMQPHLFNKLTFYSKYDPFTGVRTASILGGILFLVVVYSLYKSKCKKKEWTSQDRLFVERYKRRFHNGRKGRRNTDFAFMHEPFRGSGETSVAMEQTAKWIQSQPLQATTPKQNFKSTMGNLCLESFKATIYPVCDTNNINHMPNGNVADNNKNDIKFHNERNLRYDAYKDIMPVMKENLWKCRSYDDKVNMATISTMSSLGDIEIPYGNSIVNMSGEDDVLYEPLQCPIHSSITADSLLLSHANLGSPDSSFRSSSLPKVIQPTIVKPATLPVLYPITVTPPLGLGGCQDRVVPAVSITSSNEDNTVSPRSEMPVAFNIGTPSSCSSLDKDECFSLTSSPNTINIMTLSLKPNPTTDNNNSQDNFLDSRLQTSGTDTGFDASNCQRMQDDSHISREYICNDLNSGSLLCRSNTPRPDNNIRLKDISKSSCNDGEVQSDADSVELKFQENVEVCTSENSSPTEKTSTIQMAVTRL